MLRYTYITCLLLDLKRVDLLKNRTAYKKKLFNTKCCSKLLFTPINVYRITLEMHAEMHVRVSNNLQHKIS